MSTEMMCPDCGGVIGGNPDDGQMHCSCYIAASAVETKTTRLAKESGDAGSSTAADSDQISSDQASSDPADTQLAASPAVASKICVNCGIDVNGKKRAKDSRGYWCYDCYKQDLRKERASEKPKSRCLNCGRMVPADSLAKFKGVVMCAKCRIEEGDNEKTRFKVKVSTGNYDRAERTRLFIMIGVLVILGLIIILSRMHILHGPF